MATKKITPKTATKKVSAKTASVSKPRKAVAKKQSKSFFSELNYPLILSVSLLIVNLVLLLAAFSLIPGRVGEAMSRFVLSIFGGGIVVVLAFFIYNIAFKLAGKRIDGQFRQILGTFFLYASISMLFSMLSLNGLFTNWSIMSPGALGSVITAFLVTGGYEFLIVWVTLGFLALSAICYGHLTWASVEAFVGFLWKTLSMAGRGVVKTFRYLTTEKESAPGAKKEKVSLLRRLQYLLVGAPAKQENVDSVLEEQGWDDGEYVDEEFEEGEGPSLGDVYGASKSDVVTVIKGDYVVTRKQAPKLSKGHKETSKVTVKDPFYYEEKAQRIMDDMKDSEMIAKASQKDSPKYGDTTLTVKKDQPTYGNYRYEKAMSARVGAMSSKGKADGDQLEMDGLRSVVDEVSGSGTFDDKDDVSQVKTYRDHRTFDSSRASGDDAKGYLEEEEMEILVEDDYSEPEFDHRRYPPPMDLLGPRQQAPSAGEYEHAASRGHEVIAALADFGISAELHQVISGPTVIQYQLKLATGVKVNRVHALSNDIAMSLAVSAIRVEAPIPGTSCVGVEIPNPKRKAISLRTILESDAFQNTNVQLPLPLGVTVDGRVMVVGLEDLPHLLVAGTTGSGKSIFINNCITSLCYHKKPSELKFIMVDPKRVEMGIYESLPHMLAKPVVTPQDAVHALAWAVREMESRYEVFSRARVRSLASYNEKVLPRNRLPHIVIIVDELADLMFTAKKEVEDYICRLAQMARATGIHLILATQRPSVDVITGLIKSNVPARIAFSLPSQTDSRTIIDVSGAQHLLGKGDMLFVNQRIAPKPLRVQSPLLDEKANLAVVDHLTCTFGKPEYVDLGDQGNEGGGGSSSEVPYADDDKLEEAVRLVMQSGIASSSRIQRQLRVGFTRAARIIDTMEQMGIIGPQDGVKPREILVDEDGAEEILERYR